MGVRAVSRHRPHALPDNVEWWEADASDLEAAAAASKGAAVLYQCLNAPYTRWPDEFPPLQRAVLGAAERTGAMLVSLENLYGYGPTGGVPMTEDMELAATTVKGRTRAAMTAELLAANESGKVVCIIGRASDLFGPGVTDSTLGERFFAHAVAGRDVDFLGDPDLAHTYSYSLDVAEALAVLGTDARATAGVWHLPGPETATTRQILTMVHEQLSDTVGIHSMPAWMVRGLGLVNPMMRAVAEMSYEFDQPFILDSSKYTNVFGDTGTALVQAVTDTVMWYRSAAIHPSTNQS